MSVAISPHNTPSVYSRSRKMPKNHVAFVEGIPSPEKIKEMCSLDLYLVTHYLSLQSSFIENLLPVKVIARIANNSGTEDFSQILNRHFAIFCFSNSKKTRMKNKLQCESLEHTFANVLSCRPECLCWVAAALRPAGRVPVRHPVDQLH